jgi:hypothetical protein
MDITKDQVRVMCELQNLTVPDEDHADIAARMSLWMTAFEQIEAELGEEMNKVDPIPPVYPQRT